MSNLHSSSFYIELNSLFKTYRTLVLPSFLKLNLELQVYERNQ